MRRGFPILILIALSLRVVRAQEPPPVKYSPRVDGRPGGFVGGAFEGGNVAIYLTAHVESTTVEIDRFFDYELRFELKTGRILQAPGRPELASDEFFASDFHFEVPERPIERTSERTWVFRYRLRPKSLTVREIPEAPFYHFLRHANAADREGDWQELPGPAAIPITVVEAAAPQRTLKLTPAMTRFADNADALSKRSEPRHPPDVWTVAAFLFAPIFGCALWWVVWRLRYPDAARRARQRQSQAAKRALKSLRTIGGVADAEDAKQLASILTGYLRDRWGQPIQSATPEEAHRHLRTTDLPSDFADQARDLLEAADAMRYFSAQASADDLNKRVGRWIEEAEQQAWSTAQS